MSQITVRHDIPLLDKFLGGTEKQIPFAVMLAINATLLDAQKVQRAHQMRIFDVTKRMFVERSVKIKPRATKKKLWGRMLIEPPGGQSKADMIAKFERGGRKTARKMYLSVPVGPDRLTKRTRAKPTVASRYGPYKRTGPNRLQGQKRTFILERGKTPGLYQEVGRGKSAAVRILYAHKHSVPIPRNLRFRENAMRTIRRRWAINWSQGWRRAMRTAK